MIDERGRGSKEDPLVRYPAYVKAPEYYDHVMEDTDLLPRDARAETIARQMIRSAGSISANFEEGYGQGTTAEFVHSLRISNFIFHLSFVSEGDHDYGRH